MGHDPKEVPLKDTLPWHNFALFPETSVLLHGCVRSVCESLIEKEDHLNLLDSQAGDGDCGTTLAAGAHAILSALGDVITPGLDTKHPHGLLTQLSNIVSQSMGGTSGALYSLLLSSGAGPLRESCDLQAWLRGYKAGMDAILEYGGARVGDRTMLDAMSPGYAALSENLELGDSGALSAAVQACKLGAEQTTKMAAHAGRAFYVHPDNLNQPDPGATAFSVVITAIHKALS